MSRCPTGQPGRSKAHAPLPVFDVGLVTALREEKRVPSFEPPQTSSYDKALRFHCANAAVEDLRISLRCMRLDFCGGEDLDTEQVRHNPGRKQRRLAGGVEA